jgi:hypothetical protein
MRVSHKYKFIFLSNPQSGSSSIRAALNPYSDIISSKEPPYQHHINAIRLKAQFQEMGWDWDKYLKFTTIRNPWSRMVGRYHYGLKNPSSVWHLPAKNARIFGEFINHREVLRVSRSHTIDKFAFGENGEPLLNHILKLEDINTELPKILKKLGIYEKKYRGRIDLHISTTVFITTSQPKIK